MKSGLLLSLFSFFLFAGSAYTPSRSETQQITIVSRPIVLKSGETLDGGVFQLADGAECPVIIIGDTTLEPEQVVENVVVRNIVVLGNRENQKYETWNNQDNHIRNSGIVVRRGKNVVIENVKVENCRSGGIVIERHSEKISVVQSSSKYNQYDGLAAYQTTHSFFSGLDLSENQFAGASFDLDFHKNLFVDSVLIGNRHQAIFMRQSSRNVFRNLDIRGGIQGIFIAKAETQGSECLNNFFSKVSLSGNKIDFIVNDRECVGNVLEGSSSILVSKK